MPLPFFFRSFVFVGAAVKPLIAGIKIADGVGDLRQDRYNIGDIVVPPWRMIN